MMKSVPKLIVMLTHNDKTVPDAIEVFEKCKNTKAEYWGFKEIGIPLAEMKDLVGRMKAAGKTTFLEVVDYTEEGCLDGAKVAVDCGFDILMGTMFFPSILEYLKDKPIKYMPFVGDIYDRPSILDGTIESMIDEANDLMEKGVDGFDLLGYRYTGDPEVLNQRFVAEVNAPVCLAGSIGSYERLDRVLEYNPWTYTIGSAFFDNKFGKDLTFAQQIDAVIKYTNES
jgi:hypothetical protein